MMLYLFYGEDQERARGKWRQTLAAFRAKHHQGDVFRCDRDRFDLPLLEELTASAGLFGEKRLVAGDRLLENEEARAWFDEWLPAIVASANTFVFLEEKLAAKLIQTIERAGGKLGRSESRHSMSSGAGHRMSEVKPNPFALADALGRRERQGAWVALRAALHSGDSAEEVFWRLTWTAKTWLLVKKNDASKQPAALASLKPFVLQKTRRQVSNFSLAELERFSADLIKLWHESRRGLADFELGLERLVLSI